MRPLWRLTRLAVEAARRPYERSILDINTDATNIALQVALLVPILAGLLGLFDSFRMMRLPDVEPLGLRRSSSSRLSPAGLACDLASPVGTPPAWTAAEGRGPLALIKKPFETLVVFTLIVGVWFVVAGIVRVVSAFASREALGGNILIALLDLTAGVVILAGPDLSLATLAVIIGIVLMVRGGLLIAAGWQLRTLDRAPETDPAARAVA